MKHASVKISTLGLTKQREVVLRVVRRAEHHLTANEIFDEAKRLLPTISFATVYNSLRFLKEAGHISEIQFGFSGANRFDAKTSRHDHAICNRCGKLIDIDLKMPDDLVKLAARLSKFKPESLELTLRGLCPECK
jgi:Fur family ferric uptake transcriptional regulator/Fur family peroxide stress response transcriptional regulator